MPPTPGPGVGLQSGPRRRSLPFPARRLSSFLVAAAVVGAVVAAGGDADAQPSPAGEVFKGTIDSVQCSVSPGGLIVFEMTSSGDASGAYPGTFKEQMRVIVDTTNKTVYSVDATFTVDGSTQLDGAKEAFVGEFNPSQQSVEASCDPSPAFDVLVDNVPTDATADGERFCCLARSSCTTTRRRARAPSQRPSIR